MAWVVASPELSGGSVFRWFPMLWGLMAATLTMVLGTTKLGCYMTGVQLAVTVGMRGIAMRVGFRGDRWGYVVAWGPVMVLVWGRDSVLMVLLGAWMWFLGFVRLIISVFWVVLTVMVFEMGQKALRWWGTV